MKHKLVKIKYPGSIKNTLKGIPNIGFIINENETTKTVLKPTDNSLDFFHLVNIQGEDVTPICGPISRMELSEHFDFTKPRYLWVQF